MLAREMLATQFDYNSARNARMLACAAQCTDEQLDLPSGYGIGSLRATLVHLLLVEMGWRSRAAGTPVSRENPPLAATASVAEMRAFQRDEAERARAYIAGMSDDALAGTFTASRPGGTRTFVRWHVLQHILYHGAQHRSEVAELLTQFGQSPGDTDFIYYITEGPDAR
jgi:uncharacterized damage-inducible protein DinB